MAKKIFLENWYPSKLLGQFLDDRHFDTLIQEDCDVYKPRKDLLSEPDSEENLLLSFRKNVFDPELVVKTWKNIRHAAQQSQNRGISSGPRDISKRDWVTDEQLRVLEQLTKADRPTLVESPIVWDSSNTEVTRGLIWLKNHVKSEGFDFGDWLEKMRKADPAQRVKEAHWVLDHYISKTQYANPSMSGVAGYFDRNPRFPYCREATFNREFEEEFQQSIPFVEQVGEQFKILTPNRYAAQKAQADKIPHYRIGNSPYTTITVNKNYRTAAHRDAGDLAAGFGNLTVVTDPDLPSWEGAYTCFQEFRAAVDVRPGDMLAMDVHEIHGNTPFSGRGGFERVSVVCYFREGLAGCTDLKGEHLRYQFVESRRLDKNHKDWRPGWNGVTEGMWESQEWKDFQKVND